HLVLLIWFLLVLLSIVYVGAFMIKWNLMTAPNVLRVGTEERIFIEVQNCEEQNVDVRISVKNHPTKTTEYAWTSVTLTRQNDFQAFGKIVIPADRFVNDRNVKQYVTLQADFPGQLPLEKVVLVSFQSGYIFIQTDKPIYTPGSTGESFSRTNNLQNFLFFIFIFFFNLKLVVHVCSFGNWKMMAKFHSNAAESFTAEFEVKEYGKKFYLYAHIQQCFVSQYMFGKEVDGTAYVVFGVILGNEKKSFTSSLQRVPIQRGNGEVKLRKEHITDVYQNINQLLGNSIYVSVSVLTQSGGEMVEAELRGIMIVESPYTIHFKKTPEYFKPGLSFDVMVEVVNPDGSPADSVPILVNPGGISAVTKSNGMARLPINTGSSMQRLEISARTNHPQVLSHRQAKATMVALPYKSPTDSLLHLSVHSAEVKLGEQMKIDLYFTRPENQPKDITYMILSRGQLVKHFRQRGILKQMAFMVDITKEMLPSFRIVAFYHTNKNELVSDSVWVDVTDTCMGTLKLEMTRPTASYEPRRSFNLKITGDPGATVGLVAVDKSVYVLNNKNRLTQKKIWDVVEKYDTGCKPGGGKDAINVFYDAGLLFVNNNDVTPDRTDLMCPAPTRRKRASTVMEVRTSLISQYTDKLQKDCCLDGMKESPVSYSCKRRVQYIVDGPSCEQAFLHCCEEMQKQRDDMKVEVLHLARSEIDDGYTDRNDIMTRTNFPESWLWNDIQLSGCPTNDPNCKTVTLITKTYPFPDTITTWQLTGISLSRTHGLCVAKPLEAIVWKPFFVDLRLPYSAVQGEQLEIKAILHNYNDDVRIEFKEEDHVCSAAYKKKWFQDEVQVGAQTTRSVPFIIIPMRHGSFPIEIKASVKNSYLSDGIKKMLRVVVRETNAMVCSLLLLSGDACVRLPMTKFCGESMGTLINEPHGCGEQNMAAMTLPVIAAIYLDKTNQWEAVGFDKRNKAIQHIKTGYGTQLTYHKPDGSFAIFPNYKSTTWLTAYVAKVFSMATSHARIDSSVICGAIKFLIIHTQRPDGVFVEIGEVWDKNMIGDVGGVDSDASMTAFCLIAMRESSGICSSSISSLPNSIRKAETYLEQRLGSLTNPYAVALTSYALAMNKKLNREILFKFAAPAPYIFFSCMLLSKAIEEAKPIVRWLSQQQKENGGYGSTQATIMVYQAVAEYASNVREPPFDLNVDIAIQGRSLIDKINFNNENHYTTRTSKVRTHINKLTATGTGEAMFNVS
uniref:Complement C3 n=1 Tax=Fundulus heteroclitus TaxID=8078 RepID=A0A3Q2QK09_FUNHE